MRQVPANSSFLLIGNGRLARHLAHYFELEAIPFSVWSRNDSSPPVVAGPLASSAALPQLAPRHILLAINDSAIEPFIREHRLDELGSQTRVVHFSGALVTPLAASAHPLMTFGERLYDLPTYRAIPFVVEAGRVDFSELLPGLKNPFFALNAELKPLYHALAVASGNFTVLLWEKVFADFEEKLGLPREVLRPYLAQTAKNLGQVEKGDSVLTGPLVRGDVATLAKHLTALKGDSLALIYQAFVEAKMVNEKVKITERSR